MGTPRGSRSKDKKPKKEKSEDKEIEQLQQNGNHANGSVDVDKNDENKKEKKKKKRKQDVDTNQNDSSPRIDSTFKDNSISVENGGNSPRLPKKSSSTSDPSKEHSIPESDEKDG